MTGKPARKWTFGRILRRLFFYTAVVLVLVSISVGFVVFLIYDHVIAPGQEGAMVRVAVPEGATGTQIAEILERYDVVEDELFFRLAMKIDGHDSLKHGQYAIPRGLSPIDVLRLMREGPKPLQDIETLPEELRATVPEGLSIRQVAALFDDPEGIIEAASDPLLIARLGLNTPTLEGFLMPNTYFFDTKPDTKEIVARMVEQFEREYAALLKTYPEAVDADLLEVITVASLVEEEARLDEERPIIAAVIYNRMKRGVPLNMDSTLQFALDKYGQRLLNSDKEVDSPYNTYQNSGLPPGPISNPGVRSIEAALQPSDTDYMYFVSNADGKSHTFSRTLAEHNRAVARFRRDIAAQRRTQEQEEAADSER